MWRTIAVFLFGGVLGIGAGVAVGFFLFPFVFPPPPAMDDLTELEQEVTLATGTFIHADPSDPIHYGSGSVTVYDGTLFLERDFKVGPGPKYHVYLVPKAEVRENADVEGSMFVDLGRLRAFEGSQKYVLPAGLDIADYPSVVIWCEHFNVLFPPADLKPEPR